MTYVPTLLTSGVAYVLASGCPALSRSRCRGLFIILARMRVETLYEQVWFWSNIDSICYKGFLTCSGKAARMHRTAIVQLCTDRRWWRD